MRTKYSQHQPRHHRRHLKTSYPPHAAPVTISIQVVPPLFPTQVAPRSPSTQTSSHSLSRRRRSTQRYLENTRGSTRSTPRQTFDTTLAGCPVIERTVDGQSGPGGDQPSTRGDLGREHARERGRERERERQSETERSGRGRGEHERERVRERESLSTAMEDQRRPGGKQPSLDRDHARESEVSDDAARAAAFAGHNVGRGDQRRLSTSSSTHDRGRPASTRPCAPPLSLSDRQSWPPTPLPNDLRNGSDTDTPTVVAAQAGSSSVRVDPNVDRSSQLPNNSSMARLSRLGKQWQVTTSPCRQACSRPCLHHQHSDSPWETTCPSDPQATVSSSPLQRLPPGIRCGIFGEETKGGDDERQHPSLASKLE
jgi:hypothetical protein